MSTPAGTIAGPYSTPVSFTYTSLATPALTATFDAGTPNTPGTGTLVAFAGNVSGATSYVAQLLPSGGGSPLAVTLTPTSTSTAGFQMFLATSVALTVKQSYDLQVQAQTSSAQSAWATVVITPQSASAPTVGSVTCTPTGVTVNVTPPTSPPSGATYLAQISSATAGVVYGQVSSGTAIDIAPLPSITAFAQGTSYDAAAATVVPGTAPLPAPAALQASADASTLVVTCGWGTVADANGGYQVALASSSSLLAGQGAQSTIATFTLTAAPSSTPLTVTVWAVTTNGSYGQSIAVELPWPSSTLNDRGANP